MKYQFWLKFNADGHRPSITKECPLTGVDEVPVYFDVEIPNGIFKRPTLSASIQVPQEAVPSMEIQAEVVEDVKELLQQKTKLQFDIKITTPEPSEEEVDDDIESIQ